MDRIADEEARRAAASTDANQYIAKHPQLGQLLHDFTTAVLASRPASIHAFARDYFAQFIPPEEDEAAAAAAAQGEEGDEEAAEEALMRGDSHLEAPQEQR
jgi:hypothetical protein